MQFSSYEQRAIPSMVFKYRNQTEWAEISTADLFDNKNVIVFSLPGAFTPTCSSTHVPRFNELWPAFKALGIDAIVCISVNDPFVMQAWAADQQAENVFFLPDGNGKFTEAMGLLVSKEDLNFGQRSWRYSMLVRNGVVEKQFIEPDEPGDPFHVSDADTMLSYLAPQAKVPPRAVLFTKKACGFCQRAKNALDAANISYATVELPNSDRGTVVYALTGKTTVPQLFVDATYIGDTEAIEQFARAYV